MLNDSSPPKSASSLHNLIALLTESSQDAGSPEHFAAQSRQKEKSPHSLSEGVLERVQHGDISLLSHLVGEENATCTQQLPSYNIYLSVLIVCAATTFGPVDSLRLLRVFRLSCYNRILVTRVYNNTSLVLRINCFCFSNVAKNVLFSSLIK
jgi:hypothetical protein